MGLPIAGILQAFSSSPLRQSGCRQIRQTEGTVYNAGNGLRCHRPDGPSAHRSCERTGTVDGGNDCARGCDQLPRPSVEAGAWLHVCVSRTKQRTDGGIHAKCRTRSQARSDNFGIFGQQRFSGKDDSRPPGPVCVEIHLGRLSSAGGRNQAARYKRSVAPDTVSDSGDCRNAGQGHPAKLLRAYRLTSHRGTVGDDRKRLTLPGF